MNDHPSAFLIVLAVSIGVIIGQIFLDVTKHIYAKAGLVYAIYVGALQFAITCMFIQLIK